jgi:hypothetical protein
MTWGDIASQLSTMWQQIETAPFDRDLELEGFPVDLNLRDSQGVRGERVLVH